MSQGKKQPTRIAVLGGTGKEGGGLSYRWALTGHDVIIGSREMEKAQRVAAELNDLLGDDLVRGMANADAAREADIVVLTVPYAAHRVTLEGVHEHVQGKILVDVTVPSGYSTTVTLPEGRTAAEEAQAILGENVRVVSAFQDISHTHLKKTGHEIDSDVLVCGDDEQAKQAVIALVEATGMRGLDAGALSNAIVAESLAPLLIAINRRYGIKNAGIRITGIE